MSKRNQRLSQYFADVNTPQVSTEGLMDVIGSGIKGLRKLMHGAMKSPDPHDLKDNRGKKIDGRQWLKNGVAQLEKTWANPKWVRANLNGRELKAPKLALSLSYKGKVPSTPVEALDAMEKQIQALFNQYAGPIGAYADKLEQIESQAKGWFSEGKSADDVAALMVKAASKVEVPLKGAFTGPELLGGNRYVIKNNQPYGLYDAPTDYRANTDTLAKLDEQQIVAGANRLLEQLQHLVQMWATAPTVGSGCDSGVWDQLDYNELDDPDTLWDLFYYQAVSARSDDLLYYSLLEWYDVMFAVAKWLHSQVTDTTVSLESVSLATAFDGPNPQASDKDAMVGLFGTVNSDWRETLIPMLKVRYFNPIVDEWTPEAQAQEELIKRVASGVLMTITPAQKGYFSFVELTELAIQSPERLFVCILDEDKGIQWDADNQKSIAAIKKFLTDKTDVPIYTTLADVAAAINAKVPNIAADGEAGDKSVNNDDTVVGSPTGFSPVPQGV